MRDKKQEFTQIELDLKTKGDKFLYYKRRIEMVEKTIKVFPFWNNAFVWGYLSFSLATLYFLLFLIDTSFARLQTKVPLLLFENASASISKQYIYALFFIPLIDLTVTVLISHRLYTSKKYVAYMLIVANSICSLLFLIALIKFIQMNYGIIA